MMSPPLEFLIHYCDSRFKDYVDDSLFDTHLRGVMLDLSKEFPVIKNTHVYVVL